MQKLTIREVSENERKKFQYAVEVAEKGDVETAIGIFKALVLKKPGFNEARKALFDQLKIKSAALNPFAKLIGGFKISGRVARGRTNLARKRNAEALNDAIEAVAINFFSFAALKMLSDAAEALDARFMAIEVMEMAAENFEGNEPFLKHLAGLYQKANRGRDLLRVRQQIASVRPDDLSAQQELRAAAAMATMEDGKWEQEGTYQDRLKDKDQSVNLEQGDRIVRSIDDVQEMLARYQQRLADGDKSIDVFRKLGELYYKAEDFRESIAAYEKVVEIMGALDPAIDRCIEQSEAGIIDQEIAAMRARNATEAEIEAAEVRKYAYRLDRAEDRVKKYPNDTDLRYNLAVLYWEGGEVEKALEQFQIAQRNPHRRLSAMVYLGQCFAAKQQFDLSIEQFKKAVGEMLIMDKEKMNALYHLGATYELVGDFDQAVACFKDIYQANVNYRDVGQRMDAAYKRKKSAAQQ